MQAEPASSIDTLASIALKALGLPDQPVSVLEEFSARRCPRLSCGSLPLEGHLLPRLRVLDLTGEAVKPSQLHQLRLLRALAPTELSHAFKSRHHGCCPLPLQCGSVCCPVRVTILCRPHLACNVTGSGAAKGEGCVDISALRKAAPALERLQLNDLSGAFGWVALNAGSRPNGCAPWHKLQVRPCSESLSCLTGVTSPALQAHPCRARHQSEDASCMLSQAGLRRRQGRRRLGDCLM